MATARQLESSLWSFSSKRNEEEGECRMATSCGRQGQKKAKYNDQAATSLALQLKHGKEPLCENYSLYSFRSERGPISICI